MAKILITGGTGFIGKHLIQYLLNLGHEPVVLTRKPNSNSKLGEFQWDIQKGFIDANAFKNVTHIINLAGEGIAVKRWTNKRKAEIVNSRVGAVALIAKYINDLQVKPISFVGASAIGIYGAKTVDHIFTENDEPANDFLANTCKVWEEEYKKIENNGVYVSIIRFGIVIGKNGGALEKMAKPFKLGMGAALGNGRQYMPWIQINDLCSIITNAVLNEIPYGIYNAVSSQHLTNLQFSKTLASSFHKKLFLPNVPAFVLKLFLGEMSVMLLEGSRVSNEKLKKTGFEFEYDDLAKAITP